MPYRVKINLKNWAEHHEAYFHNLPTEEAVLQSIEDHRELAGEEYLLFYNLIEDVAKDFVWPTKWAPDLAVLGKPAYLPSDVDRVRSRAAAYIRIHRFEFTE